MKALKVALVGATGAVGVEFLKLFELRKFPISHLKLLASKNSAGKKIYFRNKELVIEELTKNSFEGVELAFFCAGATRSLEFAPVAIKSGALVIDNSSAFRLQERVPLVVPSCNMEDANEHQGIIANPNCCTIQMVEALKPIHDAAGIQRVIVSTYQAISGSGIKAIHELDQQISDYTQNKKLQHSVYPFPILMNAIPQVDTFVEKGYTKEEMKLVWETQKILHAPQMKINATCVRIPVLRSHSESILIETERKITPAQAIEFWQKSGVVVINEEKEGGYPTPREAIESLQTFVGRVREDRTYDNGLCFWCVADQLYKGAAWNALEIAEKYFAKK